MEIIKDQSSTYTDFRLAFYRILKQVLIILIIGFFLKIICFDSYIIDSRQMEPTLLRGDRVLISKLRYSPIFKNILSPKHTDPVIFIQPHMENRRGCLRIAGKPGDHINIENGQIYIVNQPHVKFPFIKNKGDILPYEFSPRDNMLEYHIPQKKDVIFFDTLNIKNLIFLYSIIVQENMDENYTLHPRLYINDTLNNDFFIKDFSLFTGKFGDISDSLNSQWFFWDRLFAYLISTADDKKVDLKFSILKGEKSIKQYTIKSDFYFLISDNWEDGFDSRYFGPVMKELIEGKIIAVLWSFDPEKGKGMSFRGRRIARIIQ
jgi:signal peptidase I